MNKKLLLASLFVVLMTSNVVSQMTFSGYVFDKTETPLPDITIHLEKTPYVAYTNGKGFFIIKDVPQGKYTMRVGGVNYHVERRLVDASDTIMNFVLSTTVTNLEQVVVTGTGTYHRLKNSPVQVEVFTKRELERSALTDLNAFLSFASASFNTSSSSMGSSITLNGLRSRHILILVDGQRIYGDMMGDTDLSRIDLSNVKHIEVLKGAASSLYGSDAMGGVINIITERPKSPLAAKFFTQYSRYNQLTYRGDVSFNIGKFFSETSFNRTESDGWQLSPYERIIVLDKKDKTKIAVDSLRPTSKLASGKFNSTIFNQQFRVDATEKLQFSAKLNLYKKENPRPYADYDYDFIYSGLTYGIGARYIIKRGMYLYLDAYSDNYDYSRRYNKNIVDKKTKQVEHKYDETILTKKQNLYNTNLKGVFAIGKYNTLTSIVDFNWEKLTNEESLPEPKKSAIAAIFLQDELNINNMVQVVAGLRFVYHQTFKSRLLPKISVMYKPIEMVNLRASYAAGFRAPDLMELYYEKETSRGISSGNINLKPEHSNYFSFNAEFIASFLTISASIYQNNIKNLIERRDMPLTENDKKIGITQRLMYDNTSNARIRGVDVAIYSYVGAGFSVGGSYAFTDAKNLTTDLPLSKSYQHGATANINWLKEWKQSKLNLNIVGTFQSERYENSIHGNAPAYQLWNFVTRYTVYAKQRSLMVEPGFSIDNIFNYRDRRPFGAYYNTLSPGRTLSLSLLVSFR